MRVKFYGLSLIVFFIAIRAISQSPSISDYKHTFDYRRAIPGMPENASLGSYGNLTVSTATGIPDVSFNLYTLVKDGLSIPISISYDASGIKYNDIPSTVGMKWQLNAGGSINRIVNGMRDEDYLMHFPDVTSDANMAYRNQHIHSYDVQDFGNKVSNNQVDITPDYFYYNFLGRGGSMYWDKNQEFIADKDYTKIKIKSNNFIYNGYTFFLDNFVIKDEDGNTYYFKDYKDESTVFNSGINSLNGFGSTVAWKLERIITAHKQIIRFEYTPYSYSYSTLNGEKFVPQREPAGAYIHGIGNSGCYFIEKTMSFQTSQISNSAQLLTKISTDDQDIIFRYQDNNDQSIWKRNLKAIRVFSKSSGDTIKAINFLNDLNYLTGFEEIDRLNNTVKKYDFKYESGRSTLTTITKNRDYFGYANGSMNLNSLISNSDALNWKYPFTLANRSVNMNANIGTLSEIIYPTGGTTNFTYENNSESVNGEFFYAPGLRVKTIEDFDQLGSSLNRKEFSYSNLIGGTRVVDLINFENVPTDISIPAIYNSEKFFHMEIVQLMKM